MHHFRGEPGGRSSVAPSCKLWTALRALDYCLLGQSDWLVDYGERHQAGLRVGIALTEGTANFLVTAGWPNRSICAGRGAALT
jgi:hypothetical protein